MITDFIYVNSNQTVGPVVQNYFNVYRKSEFPVLDDAGSFLFEHKIQYHLDYESSLP
jgi:hypothetical protein